PEYALETKVMSRGLHRLGPDRRGGHEGPRDYYEHDRERQGEPESYRAGRTNAQARCGANAQVGPGLRFADPDVEKRVADAEREHDGEQQQARSPPPAGPVEAEAREQAREAEEQVAHPVLGHHQVTLCSRGEDVCTVQSVGPAA